MKHFILSATLVYCIGLMFVACEKPIINENIEDDNNQTNNKNLIHLSLNANNIEASKYINDNENSRVTNTSLKDVCSRISLAIFDSTDKKIKTASQVYSDNNFGHFDINLPQGNYNILFIAHNSDGNPTISSPSEIKFPSNKITDTFYYYGNIDLEEETDYNITLQRATAKFRFVIKDNTPNNVMQMKFYYTGGSSTLDATTGYGCVNSKQTEYRKVSSNAYVGESQYEVYTFPHEETKLLKFEISALSGTSTTSTTLYSKIIDNVTMKRNTITQYSGYYFGEEPSGGRGFDIRIDSEWEQEDFNY